jgi:diguanylate cyclase (GGDEF)-like protein
MKVAPKPENETMRLRVLQTAQVLDTAADERLDSITRLAQKVLDVPIALVSLVDANRQWFKSRQGLDVTETPRDVSFCSHAILSDDLMVIEDSLRDERFFDNPLVLGGPRVRFYAGHPLKSHSGHRLGTLCVIDTEPRDFTDDHRQMLSDLGRLAEQQLRSIALAMTDELTQISNRRGLMMMARQVLSQCHRSGLPVGMVAFDLDNFKRINDTLGHDEGDRVLVDFAGCLLKTFRDADAVGRLGGDEFCAVLANADAAAAARALARLDQHVAEVNEGRDSAAQLAFSAGLAIHDGPDAADLDQLLMQADAAMYRTKQQRRDVAHSP